MIVFAFLLFSLALQGGIRDYLAARAYGKQDYPKAVEAYTKLVELYPENSTYIYGLANTLYQLQDYQQAAHYYALLSQQMRGLSQEQQEEIYFNSGAAFAQQQQWKEALASFEAVLKINPQHERAKKNRDIIKKLLEQPPQQNQQQNKQDNEKQQKDEQKQQQDQKNSENNNGEKSVNDGKESGAQDPARHSRSPARHSREGGNPNKRQEDQSSGSQRREQQDKTAGNSESKQNTKKEKNEQERKKNGAQEQRSQANQNAKNERGGSANDSTDGHEKQGDKQRLQQNHNTPTPSLKEGTGKEEKTQGYNEWQDKLSWQQQQQLTLVEKLDKDARQRMMRMEAAQMRQQGNEDKNEQTW